MADATPFVTLPADAAAGIAPTRPAPMSIGGRTFAWGARTFLMGIVNVTPDSFSGDGLMASGAGGAAGAALTVAGKGGKTQDAGEVWFREHNLAHMKEEELVPIRAHPAHMHRKIRMPASSVKK